MSTDKAIDSELFILFDSWPDCGQTKAFDAPTDGFTGATHHNVVAKAYPIGQKITVYNADATGEPGFSTFIYLQVGTQNDAEGFTIAAKSLCVPDSASNYYKVTNDPDDCIRLPTNLACYALSAMTNAYYGWFWCGGVCPETWVSDMGGDYECDGSVAAGPFVAHNLSANMIGLSLAIDTTAAQQEGMLGFALTADG